MKERENGVLESFVAFTNDILWSYVLIVMLVGLGIWFSLRTRFVQVRCLKEMVRSFEGRRWTED